MVQRASSVTGRGHAIAAIRFAPASMRSLWQDLIRIGLDGRLERAKLLRMRDQLGGAENAAGEQRGEMKPLPARPSALRGVC